jgi:TM2 domain-containing membrane protein YozV
MLGLNKFIWVVGLFFLLSACGVKGGGRSPLLFKRITPAMETEMKGLIEKGCDKEYQFFDRDIAMLYSLIPGGGQWYTGETRKAWIYLASFPLIVPYIISFQDAQNSVDYYNFRYTAHFCKTKFQMSEEIRNKEYLKRSSQKHGKRVARKGSSDAQFLK